MNKKAFNLFIVPILCLSFLSCGDDEKVEQPSILGVWQTTDWSLDTGNKEVDDWVNGILRQDLNVYTIKREFRSIDNGDGSEGSVNTTGKKIGSTEESDDRTRLGTYKIEGNVMYIDEEQLGKSESVIQIGDKVLITETTVNKEYLVDLLRSLGALTGGQVPDGITGTLKIREVR